MSQRKVSVIGAGGHPECVRNERYVHEVKTVDIKMYYKRLERISKDTLDHYVVDYSYYGEFYIGI